MLDDPPIELVAKPKKTLLEKLVKGVFGNKRDEIYEEYDLMSIVQPKFPIITPKGPEVINSKLFRQSIDLL